MNWANCNNLHDIYYASSVVINLLLEKGADIENKNENGDNTLHLACCYDNLDVVKFLLEKGANIEAKNNKYGTPLHLACGNDNLEVVKFLLEKGANIESKDKYDYTPLHYASMCNFEVVKLLVEKGANIVSKNNKDEIPLHLASFCGNLNIVKLLLVIDDLKVQDKYGNTPLHWAIHDFDVTKFLLEKGADVKSRNYEDETPLHRAIKHYNLRVVVLLKEHLSSITIQYFFRIITSKNITNKLRIEPRNLFDPEFSDMRKRIFNIDDSRFLK